MLGSRRAIVHLALVAMLLRAFLPVGWMPGADAGDAPLVMCGIAAIHDTPVQGSVDGKDFTAKPGDPCAFGASPVLGAPDNMIFYTPVLQDYDRYDEDTWPARDLSPANDRPAPRAPPV